MQDHFLESLLTDIEAGDLALPTLPEIAMRTKEVVEDSSCSIADVANVLRADLSLCARLLQLANCPFLRARDPITDIRTAVNRLGLDYIQYLATGFAAEQIFHSQREDLNRFLKRTWVHSLQVASMAHMLAVEHTNLKGEMAFVAGLLHDIGILPIIRQVDEKKIGIEEKEVCAAAKEHHTLLGALILESWDFPPELINVAGEHEDLQREGGSKPDYVDIVLVANVQSHIGIDGRYADLNIADVPAFQKLGLTAEIDDTALEFAQYLQSTEQ